jgi:hypothetical protein
MAISTNVSPKLKIPELWSSDMLDFVDKCLQKNVILRATSRELVAHPWIKDAIVDLLANHGNALLKAIFVEASQIKAEMSADSSDSDSDDDQVASAQPFAAPPAECAEDIPPPPPLAPVGHYARADSDDSCEKTADCHDEPAVTTDIEEPAVTTVIEEPAVTTVIEEPAVTTVIEEPAVTTVIEEPAVTTVIEEPAVTTVIEEPAVTTVIEEPAVTTVIDEPAVTTVIEEPAVTTVVDEASDAPVMKMVDVASGNTFPITIATSAGVDGVELSPPAIFTGILLKRSKLMRVWKSREFVLDSGVLRYFRGEKLTSVEKSAYSFSSSTELHHEGKLPEKSPLSLFLVDADHGWSLTVNCINESSRSEWIAHFEEHIQHMKQLAAIKSGEFKKHVPQHACAMDEPSEAAAPFGAPVGDEPVCAVIEPSEAAAPVGDEPVCAVNEPSEAAAPVGDEPVCAVIEPSEAAAPLGAPVGDEPVCAVIEPSEAAAPFGAPVGVIEPSEAAAPFGDEPVCAVIEPSEAAAPVGDKQPVTNEIDAVVKEGEEDVDPRDSIGSLSHVPVLSLGTKKSSSYTMSPSEDVKWENVSRLYSEALLSDTVARVPKQRPYEIASAFATLPSRHVGWVLKKSDYLFMWNRRYFILESCVLKSMLKPGSNLMGRKRAHVPINTDGDEYELSPATTIERQSAAGDFLISDSVTNWSITLKFESTEDEKEWIAAFRNNISYIQNCVTEDIYPAEIAKEASGELIKRQLSKDISYPPSYSGWARKCSSYVHNWNNRYFVLEKAKLTYYFVDDIDENVKPGGTYVFTKNTQLISKRMSAVELPECSLILTDKKSEWEIKMKFDDEAAKQTWESELQNHILHAMSF